MKTFQQVDSNGIVHTLSVGAFPSMTEAQRDALPIGAPHGVCPGDYIYNLTSNRLNHFDGQAWVEVQTQ